LEREHENQYDPNAVRVENQDFKKIGYLPRQVSAWLAPLLDEGKIQITNAVATESLAEHQQARMTADVFLTPKGKAILQPFPECRDEHQALHETVLLAYQQADKWDNPQAIRDLAKKLRSVLDRHSLPETHLILRMFHDKAEQAERRQSEKVLESVCKTLRSFRVGTGQHHDGISLFPILAKPNGKSGYMLLQEALEKDLASVTEVSEEGSIPDLKVTNRAPLPLLLPEGEVLFGGKQNRVINITIIIEIGQERIIPVSCVERARWNSAAEDFRARSFAPPNLRTRKTASVQSIRAQSGVAHSDQGAVWEDVDACLSSTGTHSDSEDLTEALESRKELIEESRKKFDLPKDAIGFIFGFNGEIRGLDLFDSPATAHSLWGKLSESYLFQALGEERKKSKALKKDAQSFLHDLSENLELVEHGEQNVLELAVKGDNLVGGAVVHDGTLCHLAAFST
jgi:hypothetical protein